MQCITWLCNTAPESKTGNVPLRPSWPPSKQSYDNRQAILPVLGVHASILQRLALEFNAGKGTLLYKVGRSRLAVAV
jgi:hypothetical protein